MQQWSWLYLRYQGVGIDMKVVNALLRHRLFISLIVVAIIFTVLLIRLAYVQLWIGSELATKAEDSWRRDIPFEAKRGEILDRNGLSLTYNVSSPTVMAIPAQIEQPQLTARQLANALSMSEDHVYELITKRTSSVKIQPQGRKISLDKAQEIKELDLPGIVIAEDNKRYYPFGTLASHILGFTGIDNQGLTGVELKYDQYLKGIRGSISYLSDVKGREIPNTSQKYVEPRDGLHLQLTIDKHIQTILERELKQAMMTYDANNAIGIVMDPNNGELLAMASMPDYEPDNYRAYASDIYDRNLPIWMTYEPGSTFKIITLAAALEENVVDLHNDQFFDKGFIEVGGARLRCWKAGGHGSETYMNVVENSCNPGFVVMGQKLGKETLFDYIKDFGFGAKTGIDLDGEGNGILFKLPQVGPVELATTAFGQGVSVTPIQQVAAVSAAINGGKLYVPRVAKAWIHPTSGEVIETFEPELVKTVISEKTSQQLREALESVVANGTGRNAYIDGYRVGGKTGTAQKVVGGHYSKTEHIVSFIGFAPADDPQLVVYVAVDNPKGLQFGGLIAAPIVKNVMEDTIQYLGIERRSDQLEKEYRYGDLKYEEVPDLIGMTIRDIYESNHRLQLATSGSGHIVMAQAPKPGTRVEQYSTVRIYLSDKE